MYSIALKDGKIINVNASEIEWSNESRIMKFYGNNDIRGRRRIVAIINIDNIAGYIKTFNLQRKNCDVLGKIRAKINEMAGDIETIADALAIIDKHISESDD